MFKVPSSRFIASASAAAITASLLLPAIPAAAEVVSKGSTIAVNSVCPENTPLSIDMWSFEEDSEIFPAGTYFLTYETWDGNLDFVAPGLVAPEFEARKITLTEPGRITFDIPSLGAAGRVHLVSTYRAPDGAADPAGMGEREFREALGGENRVVISDAVAIAGTVTEPTTVPQLLELPEEMTWEEFLAGGYDEFRAGDITGTGVYNEIYRIGNVFHTFRAHNGEVEQVVADRFAFGRATDEWFIGDWDGDGKETVGLRRGNMIYLNDSLTGGIAQHVYSFGRVGDEVVVGDWNGDGKDSVALKRGNQFFVSNNPVGGVAETSFHYGRATDKAVSYDWDGDGKDTIAVVRGERQIFIKNSLAGGAADATGTIDPLVIPEQ